MAQICFARGLLNADMPRPWLPSPYWPLLDQAVQYERLATVYAANESSKIMYQHTYDNWNQLWNYEYSPNPSAPEGGEPQQAENRSYAFGPLQLTLTIGSALLLAIRSAHAARSPVVEIRGECHRR